MWAVQTKAGLQLVFPILHHQLGCVILLSEADIVLIEGTT